MKIKIVYEYCTAIDLFSSLRSPYRVKCRSMSSTILVADCFSCFLYGDKCSERTVLVLQYTVYDSHTPQKIECRSLFWIQRCSTNSSCMNDEKRRIFMFSVQFLTWALCRNILLKVLPGRLNTHVFGSQYWWFLTRYWNPLRTLSWDHMGNYYFGRII